MVIDQNILVQNRLFCGQGDRATTNSVHLSLLFNIECNILATIPNYATLSGKMYHNEHDVYFNYNDIKNAFILFKTKK